jgi:HAD superfamily hydrolase (TIGR01549 family)
VPKIKAVIFDSDGTLLDSHELIIAAYHHVARSHGLPEPSVEDIHECLALAMPLKGIYEHLFPGADANKLIETNGKFIGDNALRVQAYEGLQDMLQTLRGQGRKLAILTGGNHRINDLLAFHGIDHYFSSIVHSERVKKHKPDPEGFLMNLRECGVAANEAVVVGDSCNDILAGRNGGALATIGITHGSGSRQSLEDAQADYIINSLSELPGVLATIEQS